MEILASVCFGLVVCSIIILIRNQLVFKYRMRASSIISKKAKESILNDSGLNGKWIRFYDKFEEYGSYDRMLFDITKWKFEHFYPGIEELT